jgi:hypothetical protein
LIAQGSADSGYPDKKMISVKVYKETFPFIYKEKAHEGDLFKKDSQTYQHFIHKRIYG